jgi:hypothetical protein
MEKSIMTLIDLIGRQFNKLTVIKLDPNNISKKRKWLCLCDCGELTSIATSDLTCSKIKSCGCLRKISPALRHGHASRSGRSPEHATWSNLIQRCTNPKVPQYKDYGGRGIKVCPRWLDSFESFLSDMGEKPSKNLTIERVDNDGDYEPDNCIWATRQQQNKNKRPRGKKCS